MRQLARAIGYFSGGAAIGVVTQAIKGKLTAMLLGAEGLGLLHQLGNIWNLCFTVAGLGFQNGVIRTISARQRDGDLEGVRRQFASVMQFLTGLSLFFALAGVLASKWISDWAFADDGARWEFVALFIAALPLGIMGQVYRGLLSGTREVKALVSAQIIADILSLVAFSGLIFAFGLFGAVLGYGAMHSLKLVLLHQMARRKLGEIAGSGFSTRFAWPEVQSNFSYGFTGLIMVSLGIITAMIISRWIIERIGIDANGVFSVSWKLAVVYLGTLHKSAGGYYFPSLVASETDDAFYKTINDGLILYMYLLPPLMAGLIAGADIMVVVLFSADLLAATTLIGLVLFADLFRTTSETVGLGLLARKKLVSYGSAYVVWAAGYLLAANFAIDRYGLVGVAYAYLASQIVSCMVVGAASAALLGYHPSRRALGAFLRGLAVVGAACAIGLAVEATLEKMALITLVLSLWGAASLTDVGFRKIVIEMIERVRKWLVRRPG